MVPYNDLIRSKLLRNHDSNVQPSRVKPKGNNLFGDNLYCDDLELHENKMIHQSTYEIGFTDNESLESDSYLQAIEQAKIYELSNQVPLKKPSESKNYQSKLKPSNEKAVSQIL